MERKRRLWKFVAFPLVAAIAAVAIAGRTINLGPYAFLEQFHPRHVYVDSARFLGAKAPADLPRLTMLVFKNSDAPSVLRAMKQELLPAKGFAIKDESYITNYPKTARTAIWSFYSTPPGTGSHAEGATYASGPAAALVEYTYENLISGIPGPNPGGDSTACIVTLYHEPTWIERQISAVKSWMHLP